MRHLLSLLRPAAVPALSLAVSLASSPFVLAQTRSNASGHRRAESGHRRSTANHAERVARASWSPVRQNQRTVDLPTSNRRPAAAAKQGRVAPVALVDYVDSPRATPMPPSVIQPAGKTISQSMAGQIVTTHAHPPIEGSVIEGPVIYEGDHFENSHFSGQHHGSACDALPGGCGCSDSSCDGGCGFAPSCGCDGGCDSIGSGGCCSMCGELASQNAWKPCLTLCLPQDGWASFEYLYYWQDGMDLPPLVTTSPVGTLQNQAGVLGAPGTRTLFGGNDVLDDGFDGGRLNVGVWLDKCHRFGVGGEYFRVGTETESFNASSTGSPILARPFVNTVGNGGGAINDSELVAFPGVLSGTVTVRAESRLTGAGFGFRYLRDCCQKCGSGIGSRCCETICTRSELLFGYRFLELREGVFFNPGERLTATDGSGTFAIDESFETRNQFNGVNLGWQYRRNRGFWTLDSRIRLAFGNNRQTARIAGNTVITDTTGSNNFTGGLLAQRSNIGEFSQDEFAISPDIYVGLGYQLTDHLRAMVGYNFLYLSNVIRPGGIIDTDVNPNLLPPEEPNITGVLRPEFAFDTTDYWAMGISVGGEYRW